MKKTFFTAAIAFFAFACNNSNTAAPEHAGDSANPASDTTNLRITPSMEDPNSNMADTMKMRDSIRVRDTVLKDNTSMNKH